MVINRFRYSNVNGIEGEGCKYIFLLICTNGATSTNSFFATTIFYTCESLLNENHCFSFMFYGIRRVLCIVYYTKTFSFVILWCQSNNSNSNMQSWEFLPSFISFLFALFLCSIMLQGNMAANVCVNTHQSMFHFTLSQQCVICYFSQQKNNMVHSFWLMYDRCLLPLSSDEW